ncbi:MAG TPA: PAS domain S-box protein, partial [Vicinamibacteria bacterium]|nr:PAS domain S-box protein [Vicinamibacteria bacterium]
AVIATDTDGRVHWLNASAEILTGWPQVEAIGQPLKDVFHTVHEQTRLPVEDPATRALREGAVGGAADHTLLVAKDGAERPIDDSAAAIRDETGKVTGFILVFRDVTDRRRAEAERLASARLLASIVESSEDAIISKSLEGIIQTWNAAAQRLFGYTAEEIVGRPIRTLIPEERSAEEDLIMARLREGQRIRTFDTVRVRKDGQLIDLAVTISPLVNEVGTVVGASKIARDIGPQKDAERRVYALMAELKAGDRRKDQFLATLAHEIRGPLAPIRNGLEILKRTQPGDPRADQARAAMDRQVSQVERLVEDLLDLSRITHNRLELRRRRVDLRPAIEPAIEACRLLADRFGHELRVTLPESPVYVHGDTARITQVITNLLSNACKYTEPPGAIELTVRMEGGQAVISVKDNGIGIATEMLPRVFEPFAQTHQAVSRSQGGLGIGLALVKQLVEMHQGTVEALSAGANKGSEFLIRLPLMRAEAALPGDAETKPLDEPLRLRILVVDDARDSADSLGLLLNLLGNETRTAYDGPSALAAADQFRPDVVLLDLGMPRMDGFETCRRLRENAWGQGMIVIALTGWGQPQDRNASHDAGFDHHVVKPVDPGALAGLLASLSSSRTSTQA